MFGDAATSASTSTGPRVCGPGVATAMGSAATAASSTPKASGLRKRRKWHGCPELHKAMAGVTYIADHTKKEEESTRVGIYVMVGGGMNRN